MENENINTLVMKIDSLTDITRLSLDAIREVLRELKKQNEVYATQIERMQRDIDAIAKHTREEHKEFYTRIETIERRCAVREVAVPARPCGETRFDAEAWWSKKVLRWVVVIGGPVVTFLLTQFAGRLL
jgi:predicted phage gp36 major capsid-like protein